LLVRERLDARRDRAVLPDEVRELVDDHHELLLAEFPARMFERLVPSVDTGDTLVEMASNLFDELLPLSGFCPPCRQEVDMGSVDTEPFEQFRLAHAAPAVHHVQVVAGRFDGGFEHLEFGLSVVEGYYRGNRYCNDDLSLSTLPIR
jgi:hypothetical protein